MTLGEKIQELRKRSGMTQETFADKMDVSRQAVSKWESGLAHPSGRNMEKIAELFHITTSQLENPNTRVELVLDVRKELSFMKKSRLFAAIIPFLLLFLGCFAAALYGRISGNLEESVVLIRVIASAGFMMLAFLPIVFIILRYVYRDCKIRGIKPTFWVLISTTVIGLVYYLIKRDTLASTAD